tara:strand:+ start:436 stop:543 length:108 start_codon:yes stop_codon:yes gene_type:complete
MGKVEPKYFGVKINNIGRKDWVIIDINMVNNQIET